MDARLGAEDVCEFAECPIAGDVTVAVVEALEEIDVQHHEAERALVARSPGRFRDQYRPEVTVVGEAGEGIRLGAKLRFLETARIGKGHCSVSGDRLYEVKVSGGVGLAAALVVDVDDADHLALVAKRNAQCGVGVVALVVSAKASRIALHVLHQERDARLRNRA